MQIRSETLADHQQISDLIYAAFLNHPHHAKGALPTEHLIVDQLRENNALHLSLVAEVEGRILGHIAISPVTINKQSLNWYGLGPVAVLPAHQNRGIGSQLIQTAISQLKSQFAAGIVLLGDPDYYQRFGFKTNTALYLKDVPPAYFMMLPLSENIPTGAVEYHNSFYPEQP